jgi:predicted dehydrogenase
MPALGFAYVGCGFMAQGVHIPNFADLPDVEFTALAELRPQLGEKVQRRWGFRKLYRNHLALAEDPDVQAVGLSAGFGEQAAIARDLLRAGKHVFMEKPMALSVAEAEEILAAARTTGARLMVAYMKRYDAGNETAKRLIDDLRADGSAGPLFYARNRGFCGRDWTVGFHAHFETTDEPRPDPAPFRCPDWLPADLHEPYVWYLQQYTHNANLLRWFLDAGDDARVAAVDLDDRGYTGVVVFHMNGVRATLESGMTSHHAWDEDTAVYFRHASVSVTAPPPLLRNLPASVEVYRAGDVQQLSRPLPDPPYTWSYRREAEHFVDCLRTGQPFRSSGEDTLADVRLFEDIYRLWIETRSQS